MPSEKNGKLYTVTKAIADLTGYPTHSSSIGKNDSQVLFGESFRVERLDRFWFYGTSVVDGYKGYVLQASVAPHAAKPTHAVTNLMTHLYAEPDFKTRPLGAFSFMSRVRVTSRGLKDGFVKTEGGWIFAEHLQKISALKKNRDHTEAALRFLGCPYLYGGRSAFGIDCSGLVQLALSSRGVRCPRDSHQQVVVGKRIAGNSYKRGDLIFFKGHAGIMVDSRNILNATARTMDTRIEPLGQVSKAYGGIIAARRI